MPTGVLVVVDTNVLISGLLWRGPPHTLLQRIRNGRLRLSSSPALLRELEAVFRRTKFQASINASGLEIPQVMAELTLIAEVIEPPSLPMPVSRDPDDDEVLALAIAARADLIVSGDKDLRAIGSFAGIPIVDSADALVRLGE
ncbi:MAG: putative toxin-antitoxin system toxin component, PIN family [Rhodospirillaceae bacterium]|nr:putative toxin-antitoxin system toxin component, PIN family [Rhodospirillaceae bacterium]